MTCDSRVEAGRIVPATGVLLARNHHHHHHDHHSFTAHGTRAPAMTSACCLAIPVSRDVHGVRGNVEEMQCPGRSSCHIERVRHMKVGQTNCCVLKPPAKQSTSNMQQFSFSGATNAVALRRCGAGLFASLGGTEHPYSIRAGSQSRSRLRQASKSILAGVHGLPGIGEELPA
ncbi:hypothetical protein GY45DRAFT_1081165 [Cubamyces sp. BRFM 1775]|nr:hypothetical protein GY45DRAFT_1081165 [Cubamyces sp. BRFM 1775]